MKKIWIFIFTLLSVSCNDWLEINSEKSVTLSDFFKNESELETWMNGILAGEKELEAKGSIDTYGYAGLFCDDAGASEGARRLDWQYYWDHTDNWKAHFDAIYLANVMRDSRKQFENVSSERADFWLAQASFVKAYAYFDLVRRWGEVPIPPNSEEVLALPKRPVQEVLDEAIRCAEAALILPIHEKLSDSYGAAITSKQYASLGTVHTLLANIYAWMGGLYGKKEYWEKAEQEASLVIDGKAGNYDLEPDIAGMVKNCLGKVRNSKETIFNIELSPLDIDRLYITRLEEYYPGMALLNYPYMKANPKEIETDVSVSKIKVKTVRQLYPESRDQRLKEYWFNLGQVGWYEHTSPDDSVKVYSEYAFLNKWKEPIYQTNPELQDDYTGVIAMDGNRVIWRLADLILLRAECRARLGLATAKDDLDRIRLRAGLSKYSGSTDPEILRKEIFRERERELLGEGQRYYDIVRNGYYREELLGNFKTLSDNDVENGALYLPISQPAFVKNIYMKQNTYWLWHQ